VRIRTRADIAPAKCNQTRYLSEFTAASHSFPANLRQHGFLVNVTSAGPYTSSTWYRTDMMDISAECR